MNRKANGKKVIFVTGCCLVTALFIGLIVPVTPKTTGAADGLTVPVNEAQILDITDSEMQFNFTVPKDGNYYIWGEADEYEYDWETYDEAAPQMRLYDASNNEVLPDGFTEGQVIVLDGIGKESPWQLKTGETYYLRAERLDGNQRLRVLVSDDWSGDQWFASYQEQKITVSPLKKTIKYKTLKKKQQTIQLKVSGAKTEYYFHKTQGNEKITVNQTGKITVPKKLKKGKYKLKVYVTAEEDFDYRYFSRELTITITVK